MKAGFPPSPAVPQSGVTAPSPTVHLTAQERVAATSDQFIRRFVDTWILFALTVVAFNLAFPPGVAYQGLTMLAAGIMARSAVRSGRMEWARYLIVIPITVVVLLTPLFVNGVRSPILVAMPLLILFAAWMLGRRPAATLTVVFMLAVVLYWLLEAQGWLVLGTPLRSPIVWAYSLTMITGLIGVVAWNLIGSYEINFGQAIDLHHQLVETLSRTELVNREISERNAQLQTMQEALQIAKEQAERANQAKSDFLSSMSHELRTPMNAILGFAQMLEYDSNLNADQQDNVHEILKGGRHLLELINEVLDLAKIESGHIDLSLEPLELVGLIEDCRLLIQPLATARQIKLCLEVPPQTCVRGDRVRLKQVVLNLLSNAVKYNREGGDIRLGVEPIAENRRRIKVADTGNGIAPDRLAELFQPFSRLNAENSGIEGTGIGLTITRRLVELMGGEMGVESQVGVGTTFWIELLSETTATQESEARGGDTFSQAAASSQQYRVLCIDDNPVNLKLIAQLFGKRRHIHLTTAHTPELGIELARVHRPELILLDINMPGMDGFQVLEIFKADDRLKSIPVIAVTANAMPRDIERGRAAGFTDYLTKPLDVAVFLKTIDRCLNAINNSIP